MDNNKDKLRNFKKNFAPEIIKNYNGLKLLKLLAYPKKPDGIIKEQFKNIYEENYNSLKNELENGMADFGSGSAGYDTNFVIAYREGHWYNKKRKISLDEAIKIAEDIKKELVAASNFLENKDFNSFYNFVSSSPSGLFNKGYTHKYFYILYPQYITFYHAGSWQGYYKKCLGLPRTQNYYDIEKYFLYNETGCHVGEKSKELEEKYGTPKEPKSGKPLAKYWLYAAGEKSIFWDEFYQDGIMAIGWEYLGDLTKYATQEDIANIIKQRENRKNEPTNDSKTNWEFANSMQIGDIVYVKKGLQDALIGRGIVKSNYIYDKSRNKYKSIRKVEWTHNGIYDVDFDALGIKQWNQKTLTEISPNKYGDFCLEIEQIFNSNSILQESKEPMKNIPLNQILYGPPGTGKTYSVRKYVTDIVSQNPGLKTDNEEQKINDVVKDLTWYSAIALSMYRNGKNNKYKVPNLQHQKIIKAFAATKESKKIKATLWFQMQSHTSESSKNVNNSTKQPPYLFDKTENSEWCLTKDGIKFVEENLSEQLEQLSAKNNTRKLEDFYKFITFHQSYSYEEFIEGIKPSINNDTNNMTISYEYNRGIFKEICQQANSDPDNNYLLIIDEINRGNISKIFGELITLIEPDKRVVPNGEMIFENTKVQTEELLVTLPYTKSKFGVPSNLYILGTMNTSDRSIASIDIALRRRFTFKEIMPEPKLISDDLNVFGLNVREIFTTLNKRISILLDRDHQIGHSYFMKLENNENLEENFKQVWFNCIMPLLNEYFYCDWEKLQAILGKPQNNGNSFIKKLSGGIFATDYSCDDDEIFDFTSQNEINFKEALNNAFSVRKPKNEEQ